MCRNAIQFGLPIRAYRRGRRCGGESFAVRTFMKKIAIIPLLFLIGCLFAGVYGTVHNQISYTVSPEYFTQYKFHQFRIPPALPDRIGAAIVGWNASWWMGIVIGIVVIPFGLKIPGTKQYFIGTTRSFAIVALTALVIGLLALLVAFIAITPEFAGQQTRFGNEIDNDAAFTRAWTMHSFSYLGGLVGIITGCFSIVARRRRILGDTKHMVT